jgi:peptidoglycan/xylan/chitin deacetylase (PgdA/CDA1 family)
VKQLLKTTVGFADRLLSFFYLTIMNEESSLIIFIFHNLFENQRTIGKNIINPQQRLTLKQFSIIVEYFLAKGYQFITQDDLSQALEGDGKYGLLTFDDGYFNNINTLPILKQYQVPAVFFIASNQVLHDVAFWWDVLYRERKKQGMADKTILKEQNELKKLSPTAINDYLVKAFGLKSLKPISDIDRPFTPIELKSFAQEKEVTIGNHTADHAILTNCSPDEAAKQIDRCQQALFRITGIFPRMISYPNGNYSSEIIQISRKAGLSLGISVDPRKNKLPMRAEADEKMCLGRFTLFGTKNIKQQCEAIRAGFSLYDCLMYFK